MKILFWVLFAIQCICLVGMVIADFNRNYRRKDILESVVYIIATLLLVIAVASNMGLISW